jgi:hypothetical protein
MFSSSAAPDEKTLAARSKIPNKGTAGGPALGNEVVHCFLNDGFHVADDTDLTIRQS